MNNVQKMWRRSRLKTKLLLAYSLLILVSMGFFAVFTFSVFSKSLQEKIVYSANHSISQTCDFLDYKFSHVLWGLNQAANDILIRENLSRQGESDIKTEYWNMLDLKKRLLTYQNSDEIVRIRLYVKDELLAAKDGIHIFGINSEASEPWMRRIFDNDVDVHSFSDETTVTSDKDAVLSFAKEIKSMSDYNQAVGYVRVDISKEDIRETLLKADPTKDSITYLFDESGLLVASSRDGDYFMPEISPEEVKKKYLDENKELVEVRDKTERYLVSENYLYHPGWIMVTVIPYRGMMQEVQLSQLRYLIAALTLLMLVGVLIYFIANSVTRRVVHLADHMQRVQHGVLDIHAGDGGEDEIGLLYNNFNFMIERTKGLLTEKYELGKQAQNSELKALQSQINPHFLYNTLDMIKWYSYTGKNEEIDNIVTELARFYKLTLNHGKEIVTVEEETIHSRAYVTIQNYRFQGAIQLEVHIPEEMKRCPIPKITLQPLIENSIFHGILEKEEGRGRICLTGELKEGEAVLYLNDNGVGMSQEVLDGILYGKNRSDKGSGFGVRNIHERLRMIYGEKAGLVYNSKSGEGTTVEIHLGTV